MGHIHALEYETKKGCGEWQLIERGNVGCVKKLNENAENQILIGRRVGETLREKDEMSGIPNEDIA
jgi:hypothetical protein